MKSRNASRRSRALAAKLPAVLLFSAIGSVPSFAAVLTLDAVSFNSAVGSQSNYPNLYFSKFNSSLGTLQSVTFDWVVNSSVISASVTNQSAGSVTINRFQFSRSFSATGPGDMLIIDDYQGKTSSFPAVSLSTGQTKTVNNVAFNQVAGSAQITDDLGAYVGSGNASLTLNNAIGVTPNVTAGGDQELSWLTNVSGSSDGTLTVSYNYTPVESVPEPGSFLLCGVPLLLGGAALLKRRPRRVS